MDIIHRADVRARTGRLSEQICARFLIFKLRAIGEKELNGSETAAHETPESVREATGRLVVSCCDI